MPQDSVSKRVGFRDAFLLAYFPSERRQVKSLFACLFPQLSNWPWAFQKPNRLAPSFHIPIPTKLGPKMEVEFTYPPKSWDPKTVLTTADRPLAQALPFLRQERRQLRGARAHQEHRAGGGEESLQEAQQRGWGAVAVLKS